MKANHTHEAALRIWTLLQQPAYRSNSTELALIQRANAVDFLALRTFFSLGHLFLTPAVYFQYFRRNS